MTAENCPNSRNWSPLEPMTGRFEVASRAPTWTALGFRDRLIEIDVNEDGRRLLTQFERDFLTVPERAAGDLSLDLAALTEVHRPARLTARGAPRRPLRPRANAGRTR